MNFFRKLKRRLKVWAFGQRPVWFGHKLSLGWDEYEANCLEPYLPLNSPLRATKTYKEAVHVRIMRAEVRTFLEENNGVVEVITKVFHPHYGWPRKYRIYHICFLDDESLVAFKLAFM